MADGSIIIDTRIDTGGVLKGINAVKAGMTRISAQVSKMGDSAKSSFQRQITAITGLYQNYEKQERKVSELKSKLQGFPSVRWFRNWVNMAYRLRKQRRFLSNMERKPECQVHLLKK